MKRRVLIVVSSYAPAMIADMHRARQLAWDLPPLGWDVEVLSPDESFQQPFCLDPDSDAFFYPDTPVHRVRACCLRLFQRIGMGGIGWRALLPMLLAGRRLLRRRHFDLVYLTTTQFPLFLLGPLWKRWFGVPYVLDVHDPVCRDERKPMWTRASSKHRISRGLMCRIESLAVNGAAGLVAVSPAYLDVLRQRYGSSRSAWMREGRSCAIPFGVLPSDLDKVRAGCPTSEPAARAQVVYVGAGGPIMRRSFGMLCRVLASIRNVSPSALDGIGLALFGTHFGWSEGGPCHLAKVAAAAGVGDLVHEDPRRVTYRGSLERLLGADGALILGVEDDGYMPSKLFSYAWSGKPLLAVLRRRSPPYTLLAGRPELGHALWFDHTDEMPLAEAAEVVRTFLSEVKGRQNRNRKALLVAYTASEMARRHAVLFNHCVEN